MAIPSFARAIPNDVLQSTNLSDVADQWASDQMGQLADAWETAQTAAPPPDPSQSAPPAAPPLASSPAAGGDASSSPPPMPVSADAGDRQSQDAGPMPPTPTAGGADVTPSAAPPAPSAPTPPMLAPVTAPLVPPSSSPTAPVTAPLVPPAAAATPPPSGASSAIPDWLRSLIVNNAPDDLKGNEEFIQTVAAGAKAESGWNPASVQKGGGGRGLFQFDLGGMGAGLSDQQLFDPQFQAAKIIPVYASAYRNAPAGLSGAAKASWVAGMAERPLNYQDAGSTARQNYASAFNDISRAPSSTDAEPFQGGPQSAAPAPASNPLQGVADAAGNAAGSIKQAAGDAANTVGNALQNFDPAAATGQVVSQLVNSQIGPAAQAQRGAMTGLAYQGDMNAATGQPVTPEQTQAMQQVGLMAGGVEGGGLEIGDLSAQLAKYAPEVRQGLQDFVQAQSKAGQPLKDIGDTVRQWMSDNPPPEDAAGTAPAAPTTPASAPPAQTAGPATVPLPASPTPAATPWERAIADNPPGRAPIPRTAPTRPVAPPPPPAPAPAATDWPTQLQNLKATPEFQRASPSQQTQLISDAQTQFANEQPPAETFDAQGNQVTGPTINDTQAAQGLVSRVKAMPQNVSPDTMPTPGTPGGDVNGPMSLPMQSGGALPSAANPIGPPEMPPTVALPNGVTQDMVDAAHARIDKAIDLSDPANQAAHDQLDQLLTQKADPGAIARFLTTTVEGKSPGVTDALRTLRTGALAGGINTEGKVLLGPFIQTAMRAPVAAVKALVTGNAADIPAGLRGGLGGLASGAQDALQTLRYGTNYRTALTGATAGGQSLQPGIDVLGTNPISRALGAAATGLVRTHGAIADISAGIGRGAATATGATPEAAAEAGQQWAMRSGNYGTVGQAVSDALEGLKSRNPALNVVGQILIPFYRIGYNAMTQGIERSPVGLAGTAIDVARGAAGQGPYAANAVNTAVTPVGDRLANNMFGVGLAALGLAQAAQGNITGERPQGGAPKWSVRVAGNWVPISTLGPAGEALAQSATLYEAARDGKGDVAKTATDAATAYAGHVANESWVGSISDIFSAIGDLRNLGSPNKATAIQATKDLQYQGGQQVRSVIPQSALISQTAKDTGRPDPIQALLQGAGVVAPTTTARTGAPRAPTAPRAPSAPRVPVAP